MSKISKTKKVPSYNSKKVRDEMDKLFGKYEKPKIIYVESKDVNDNIFEKSKSEVDAYIKEYSNNIYNRKKTIYDYFFDILLICLSIMAIIQYYFIIKTIFTL